MQEEIVSLLTAAASRAGMRIVTLVKSTAGMLGKILRAINERIRLGLTHVYGVLFAALTPSRIVNSDLLIMAAAVITQYLDHIAFDDKVAVLGKPE